MDTGMKRREFLGATTMGTLCLGSMMRPADANAVPPAMPMRRGITKTRIGRVYLGNTRSGWPVPALDLKKEVGRFEAEFKKLAPAFEDIEFVDAGLVSSADQMPDVMEKFQNVDGILVLHLTLGTGGYIRRLLELDIPVTVFTTPYAGHEWHIIAPLQKQGKKIEIVPSGDFADLVTAIRPIRAIHRMKEAKILYLMGADIDAEYAKSIRDKFGTEIKTVQLDDLIERYKAADENAARKDAQRWIKEAENIVEPTEEEIHKASRMYIGLRAWLEEEQADAITINCLGMGLVERGMAYPCLGFSRLNGMGLGGICEADIKSTMTHLIFLHLTGKPGFITDPVVDLSNNTIIHAHCVAAIKMDGIDGEQCPYIIRCHHEDGKSVALQVKMRIGEETSLARLIGNDIMLFSTGKIVDVPTVDRGCKTKVTTKVKNARKLLENWSCGLHRVMFYGNHRDAIQRFCRFKDIRLALEEEEDMFDVPGLEWKPYVHA